MKTLRQNQLDFDFYRARLEQYQVLGTLVLPFRISLEFTIGLGAQYTDVDEERGNDNILNEPQLGINLTFFLVNTMRYLRVEFH